MDLIGKISKYLTSSSNEDGSAYWIYVRCNKCGERLRGRVNLYNDLSVEYQGRNEQTYQCRKTLVGRTGCFQRIELDLIFNKKRKLVEREISGGDFIEADEFSKNDSLS